MTKEEKLIKELKDIKKLKILNEQQLKEAQENLPNSLLLFANKE